MSVEIERKFLVNEKWKPEGRSIHVKQGYLPGTGPMLVRVRQEDKRAFLTLKGRTEGITRSEYEYEIPMQDAGELLERCEKPIIEKTRYLVPAGPHTWEVDVFAGANEGLVVAEIELSHEDEPFDRPAWLGREVSDDTRYYNSNLAAHPYCNWEK
ncbi:MAG: CYTH domain-containing protein [Schwartzia sp.]|nr:CYTH domain-containing protein [Schwartzia sp. (in: firmicutes)]